MADSTENGAAGSGIAAVRGLSGKTVSAFSHAAQAQAAMTEAQTLIQLALKHMAEFTPLPEAPEEEGELASEAHASLAKLDGATAKAAALVTKLAGMQAAQAAFGTVQVKLVPSPSGEVLASIGLD